MQNRVIRIITGTLLLLSPGVLTPGMLRGEDAREIVRRSVTQDMRNEKVARNYTYKSLNEIRDLDSAGKVKATHSTLEEVLFVGGTEYFHLLERDGKPLPAAEEKKEEAKLDRAVKEASGLSAQEREEKERQRDARRAKNRERLKFIPDAFDFTLEGSETLNGREAWKVRAEPRSGYKGPFAFVFRNMEGTLWIDKEDHQWAKVDADVLGTVSIGLFLARIGRGTRLSFERSKVNGELWAPVHISLKASGRLALLKKIDSEQEVAFSDYRKFQTDSRIVDGQ